MLDNIILICINLCDIACHMQFKEKGEERGSSRKESCKGLSKPNPYDVYRVNGVCDKNVR